MKTDLFICINRDEKLVPTQDGGSLPVQSLRGRGGDQKGGKHSVTAWVISGKTERINSGITLILLTPIVYFNTKL